MLSIPPRTTTLDPDQPLEPTLTPGRPWWEPLAAWPATVHFEDVDAVLLARERKLDAGKLGPPPAPAGVIGCTAAWCIDSPLAELDLTGPPPRRATILRRRFHPLDRQPLRVARGGT